MKSGDFFLLTKFERTHFKLSKDTVSVSMKHSRKYLRYLRSHEGAFFQLSCSNFGKFVSQLLETF